ncbi:hypothetical protein [Mycobacteroides abscessus]|uniref:hypothetical protein n=1 Tax=Mycobacteroides abscessus TaxID=36809 RepID=UPI001643B28F|nr:hypothetical protein [Mycobacteroides abscessus]
MPTTPSPVTAHCLTAVLLVPPPGLEPGTCGLKDRRMGQKIRRFASVPSVVPPFRDEPERIAA